jgi:integrase
VAELTRASSFQSILYVPTCFERSGTHVGTQTLMPVKNLTAHWVAKAPSPLVGRVDYFDQRTSGLGLRVSPRGGKIWFVMYRVKGDPKKRRLTLDGYPALTLADARERAQEVRLAASRGQDPAAEKQELKAAATFATLATEYLDKHAKRKKRSWKEDERAINRELVPVWGRRKVHDIRRKDVLDLLDRIVDRGSPIQANRTLALVRKIFNWGIGRGIVEHNPCLQVEAPSSEHQRQRVLSKDEIRALWGAFDGLGPIMGSMFKLRLLTAQRGGEVQSMRWQDIDLDNASWTIPPEHAKNGLAHFVPLSAAAVALLSALRSLAGNSAWVFPSRTTEHHIDSVQKAASRVRVASGVTDFVLHDLRRTAASYMTGMGISRLVVGKILNHVEQGVTQVYDRHSYDMEKRAALKAWAAELRAIIDTKVGDVTTAERSVAELVSTD